jgi:hypothetical protein
MQANGGLGSHCAAPLGWRSGGLVVGCQFGRAEGGINLRLNAPSGERRQPGLRSAGFDLVADLEPPFPDIRFGGRHDRVFYAFVDHGGSQFPW